MKQLRAGLNVRNKLLVTSVSQDGVPAGVAPDVASAIAARLGAAISYLLYPSPVALAGAADRDEWDIGMLAADPAREDTIAFTAPYARIASCYLVTESRGFTTAADVDQPDVRIAVPGGAAYALWLERNLRHARLISVDDLRAAHALFRRGEADVVAGLRPQLLELPEAPGQRILDEPFTSAAQAVGVPRAKQDAVTALEAIVESLKADGFVAQSIERHGARGLDAVPPSAPATA
jgi:polar amino acid transport system substrate-binding protein